jgi:hypothetical protein
MITGAIALVTVGACGWKPSFEEVDLGVDVRLNAVESDPFSESFIAVGSGGTVVRDDSVTWDLGDVELRDIQREPAYEAEPSLWFVVGDAGSIAVGRQPNSHGDIEWLVQETGTTANLHGVAALDETTPIVVGDEVVLIGQPTPEEGMFEWIAEPTPPGGWGQLRDVEIEYDEWDGDTLDDEAWIRAVGLQGRIWLVDSQFEEWLSLDAGTDEDLLDVYSSRICGTRGTIVTCGGYDRGLDECTSERVGEFDFVACHELGWLGTDRRIHVDWAEGGYLLDWQPQAIDELWGSVVVGDGGHAGWWRPDAPLHEL